MGDIFNFGGGDSLPPPPEPPPTLALPAPTPNERTADITLEERRRRTTRQDLRIERSLPTSTGLRIPTQ